MPLTPAEIIEFDRRIDAIGEEAQRYAEAAHESNDPAERRQLTRLAGECFSRIKRVAKDIVAERKRPTPEAYLEYRPEGCGHDAETMPF